MVIPEIPKFNRDATLLLLVGALSSISFFGIHVLLKVLYVLRLGYGPEYVGWFTAAGALTYMAMGIPSGALGGRWGTRRVMLFGGVLLIAGMVVMPMAAFVSGWLRDAWSILAQLVAIGGWSLFNVNLTPALKEVVTPENANQAFAMNGALRGLGTFSGTIAGGLLPGLFARLTGESIEAPAPYRWAMWVGALVALLAMLPLLWVRQGRPIETDLRARCYGRFPVRPIVWVAIYVYLSQAGWGTCHAFFNAYADADLSIAVSAIGVISGLGQFLSILAPLALPKLAARRSNGWAMAMTTGWLGISLLPLALIPHWASAGLGRLSALAAWSTWYSALQAFQMELVEERWRTLAYGIISMAMGFGFGTVSLTGGYVAAARGYPALFGIGVTCCAAGAVLMLALLRHPTLLRIEASSVEHRASNEQRSNVSTS